MDDDDKVRLLKAATPIVITALIATVLLVLIMGGAG